MGPAISIAALPPEPPPIVAADPASAAAKTPKPGRNGAVKFRAELDLAELDDRRRPGPRWAGRGVEISRSHIILRSKRMCYSGRLLLVAVHMIDDRPVPLFGQVKSCDYDGDGLYITELTLLEFPDEEPIRHWAKSQGAQGAL